MSEMMEGLKERFLKWRSALESKGLKVNFENMKVMVCVSEGEIIQSRLNPCRIGGKRVTVNLVLCTKCNQWTQSSSKCDKFFKKISISMRSHEQKKI